MLVKIFFACFWLDVTVSSDTDRRDLSSKLKLPTGGTVMAPSDYNMNDDTQSSNATSKTVTMQT